MTVDDAKRVVHSAFPYFEVEEWEWSEIAEEVGRIVSSDDLEKATDVILKWESYRVNARRDAATMRKYAREHNIK